MNKGDLHSSARFLRVVARIVVRFTGVGLAAGLLIGSAAQASTLFRTAPEQGGLTQSLSLLRDGFSQFGASISQGYREVGKDLTHVLKQGVVKGYKDSGKDVVGLSVSLKNTIASYIPWTSSDSQVYASDKNAEKLNAQTATFPVSPTVNEPVTAQPAPIVALTPPSIAPTPTPSTISAPQKTTTVTYVVTKTSGGGVSSDEVKKIVAQSVNDSVRAATQNMVTPDSLVSLTHGLSIQGDLDLSHAHVIGFGVSAEPAVIHVTNSSGVVEARSIITGTAGGVSTDFSVGGNLTVNKNVTINGTATIVGATFGSSSADSTTFNGGTASFVNATNFDLKNSTTNALTIEGTLMTFDTANGRIGINSSSPNYDLDVGGSFMIAGNGVLGDSSSDTLTVNATSTFANTLGINGNAYIGDASTDSLSVNASSTFANTAGFNGDMYIGNATSDLLTVTATTTFVTGISSQSIIPITNASYDLGSAGTSYRGIYASNTLHVGRLTSGALAGAEMLIVSASGASGYVSVGSSTVTVGVTGYNFVVGDNQAAYFGGRTLIGDTSSDTLTVNATTTHNSGMTVNDIMPGTNNTYNLGSNSKGFQAIYASTSINLGPLAMTFGGATTTFTSYAGDASGGVAFDFNTNNGFTSSQTAYDRMLFVVRNATVRKFAITPGGNVLATNSFIANASSANIGDLAEYVDLSPGETVASGDAVQADPHNPGKFKLVTEKNATNVAGIISNTAAFVMGAAGESRAALGLSGIVYTKVTDENGPIAVGDLLVTSSKPGRLMKYNSANSAGALIVGSAIEPLDSGDGVIKVIVRSGAYAGGSTLTTAQNADGSLAVTDLQGKALLNIASLAGANNKWSIDEDGHLVAKQVKAEKFTIVKSNDPAAAMVGSGTIEAGQIRVEVPATSINEHSRVFVTFTSNLDGHTFFVTNKVAGTSFTVELNSVAQGPLSFDYWILDVDEQGTEATPTAVAPTGDVPGAIVSSPSAPQLAVDAVPVEVVTPAATTETPTVSEPAPTPAPAAEPAPSSATPAQ